MELYSNYKLAQEHRPTYHWSLITAAGRPIGSSYGDLKLELAPTVSYQNRANQKAAYFQINSEGLRGADFADQTSASPPFILLGGSTAFGTGLDSDAQTFAELLAKQCQVRVLNAAVIGYRSSQELAILLTKMLKYRPSKIIVFDGYNDFVAALDLDQEKVFADQGFEQIQRELERLSFIENSNLFYRVVFGLTDVAMPSTFRALRKVSHLSEVNKSISSAKVHAVAEKYLENIGKIDFLTKALGSRLIWILQPTANSIAIKRSLAIVQGQESLNEFAKKYIEFVEIVKARQKGSELQPIDAHDYLELSPEMFLDDVHLNEQGNKVISHAIAKTVGACPE